MGGILSISAPQYGWIQANGEWDNGEWCMANGIMGIMGNGVWRMVYGEWGMGNGEWGMVYLNIEYEDLG
jgi:hypothetical protein